MNMGLSRRKEVISTKAVALATASVRGNVDL